MKILIGIQARSNSERLPGKAFQLIGGKSTLSRVISACQRAAEQATRKYKIDATVCVLTPTDDPIAKAFSDYCDIIEGPELNVLQRYWLANQRFEPDYIVRITGDCPMIPPYVIDNMIGLTIGRKYDYFSNVDEDLRTSIDGVDCEVISKRLFEYLALNARDPFDLEHVTTLLRREPPPWASIGIALNYFDMSHLKYSVDTLADLERVRSVHDSANEKYRKAMARFGQKNVHRV